MQKNDNIKSGIALTLTAYAVVTLGDALAKKAMLFDGLMCMAFYSNVFSLLILTCLSFFNGGPVRMIKTTTPHLHFLRGLIFLGVYIEFLYAIANMGIALTYTLYLTQPFILVCFAHIFTKERIGPHRIASILLSFTGVMIVLRPGFVPIDLAALCALLCAFLFAAGNIMVKFIDKNENWMVYVFYILAVQTPAIGIYMFYFSEAPTALPSTSGMPFIVCTAALYTAASALFPQAIHRIDAGLFGAFEYTILIWGSLFGYFLFSEVPDGWTIAGAGVIVASGLHLMYREHKAGQRVQILES